MSEDKKIAEAMVQAEIKEAAKLLAERKGKAVSYDDQSDWPDDDGSDALMVMVIGVRGSLSKGKARQCAAMWREATRRYPRGSFVLNLLGYDEDPREIWNIAEAARYVRWWARFAGMDDIKTAERYALDAPDKTVAEAAVGFLAACGVYGDEMKAAVLRNHQPSIQPQ